MALAVFIAFLVCYMAAVLSALYLVLSILVNGIAQTKNPNAVSWRGTTIAVVVLIVSVICVVLIHVAG
jgi:hypothetical protein